MTILVIAAHPDDEVLGCGGTIRRLADEGHDIYVTILGEGLTSRHARREDADPDALETLRTQSREAARLLGARSPKHHGLPDNRFDTVPLLDIVKILEDAIAKLNPEVVFTQHGGDLNIDHAVTYRATLTATRPIPGQVVRRVYAYEVPSSTEYAVGHFAPRFHPTVWYDITLLLDRKIAAFEAYAGEVREHPHPRSPEMIRALARRRGAEAGVEAAEAFELVRSVY